MMPWRTTSGCRNSPSPVTKQKFRWLSIATSKLPALSSRKCCGFRLQQDLIRDFQTTGQVARYNEVRDVAIEATFKFSFGGSHTPRMCLLRSVSAVLCTSPEKDWDVNREVKGWGLDEWPVFCHLTVTVKTIFPMSEDGRNP